MFTKPKTWMSGGLWKPKNPHSLEHLKYLYNVLCKNQTVTEQNKGLLVETLRAISEILIWGDQNDSTVFDFFLEKNMLAFFLRFMRQKLGVYICVQLLQLLNILFENIRNETSVYYLLSNNYINSIIVHKFDFSDEEVMAYYISFLKTLSLKLNKHTIHFFYNEHTNDFALYTEAIKFFNHAESMVRIAVRTITLNVYRIEEKSMLRYIRDKTAAPYFSNLVWFIGNHVLEVDTCIRHDTDHNSRNRLADLVAEHLDHLHYLNDILSLHITTLNDVLSEHLLNRLLLPLYVFSLTKRHRYAHRLEKFPHVSPVVSLFLLSQVFLILHHCPLVRQLADIIFHGNTDIFLEMTPRQSPHAGSKAWGFIEPDEPLAKTLDNTGTLRRRRGKKKKRPNYSNSPPSDNNMDEATPVTEQENTDSTENKVTPPTDGEQADSAVASQEESEEVSTLSFEDSVSLSLEESTSFSVEDSASFSVDDTSFQLDDSVVAESTSFRVEETVTLSDVTDSSETHHSSPAHSHGQAVADDAVVFEEQIVTGGQNSTDEEKLLLPSTEFSLTNRPYLSSIFEGLDSPDDYDTLFALCLIYAWTQNNGMNQELLDTVMIPTDKSPTKHHYNVVLVEKLIGIISRSCQSGSKVRLATLELCILLMKTLVLGNNCYLQDRHLAAIEGAREEATFLLRNFYKVWEKSEEIFLDMFEDEHRELRNRPLNVEYLTMDASLLLPPTGTPLTGIDFKKRLPCGEVERARRAIRVFFLVRELSMMLRQEPETCLPLTKHTECISVGDILDLNNSDLIACTVLSKENKKERRFLVIDILQLILVEPDSRRLGWGVVKFVGFLQDVEVTGDKEDSRCLHITLHSPPTSTHRPPDPLLAARFMFDDHIRSMAAKQRLTKGRLKARQRKMQMIARLLEIPGDVASSSGYRPPSSPVSVLHRTAPKESRAGTSSDALVPGRGKKVGHQVVRRVRAPATRLLTAPARSHTSPAALHDDVDVAEEARPDIQASQTLNQSTSSESSRSQSIPMEDISKKLAERRLSPSRHSDGDLTATEDLTRRRSWSSPPDPSEDHSHQNPQPKSLTPAQNPAVSLVLSCDTETGSDVTQPGSPKLLPPVLSLPRDAPVSSEQTPGQNTP